MGRVNEAPWGILAEPDRWELSATRHVPGKRRDGPDAHAVEFIAKPGKTDELCDLICEDVAPILQKRDGFIGVLVLTSRIEPRRVMAITLWENRQEEEGAMPEETALAGEALAAVADFCSRVRTYRVNSPTQAYGERRKAISLTVQ